MWQKPSQRAPTRFHRKAFTHPSSPTSCELPSQVAVVRGDVILREPRAAGPRGSGISDGGDDQEGERKHGGGCHVVGWCRGGVWSVSTGLVFGSSWVMGRSRDDSLEFISRFASISNLVGRF